jgi:hypothetical protein
MAHKLDRHPVRVAVDADQSEQGLMVFADGVLVAVFSYLKETVDGELQDRWYLEAGFGPCDGTLPHPTFNGQDEAEQWVSHRLQFPEEAKHNLT